MQAELEEAERTLESAAGLSIARQISISQSQRQLLRPIQSRTGSGSSAVHRKAVGSGSISSVNSGGGERDGATGLVVPVAGLGSNKENDAMLLSSGGFNNPIPASTSSSKTSSPEPHTARIESSSSTSSFIKINSAGGFDFNNYERPSISHHQRGQSFETGPEYITTTTTGSGRDRERERPVVGGGGGGGGRGGGMGGNTMSSSTSTTTTPEPIMRKPSGIHIGAMGVGAVLKQETRSATPTIVEPEMDGKGMGHRYQRSERVVLDG